MTYRPREFNHSSTASFARTRETEWRKRVWIAEYVCENKQRADERICVLFLPIKNGARSEDRFARLSTLCTDGVAITPEIRRCLKLARRAANEKTYRPPVNRSCVCGSRSLRERRGRSHCSTSPATVADSATHFTKPDQIARLFVVS